MTSHGRWLHGFAKPLLCFRFGISARLKLCLIIWWLGFPESSLSFVTVIIIEWKNQLKIAISFSWFSDQGSIHDSQTWDPFMIPRPGFHSRFPDLGSIHDSQTWVPFTIPRPGFHSWFPDLGSIHDFQTWDPFMIPRPGFHSWFPDLGSIHDFQTWVPFMIPRPGFQT